MKRFIFKFKFAIICGFVLLLLIVNKIMIRLVPFKKLLGLYSNSPVPLDLKTTNLGKTLLINRIIKSVISRLPWRPLCFEQSLTTMVLARIFRLPAIVYFGIKKDETGQMLAHAWSNVDGVYITGYDIMSDYTTVYKMAYVPPFRLEKS